MEIIRPLARRALPRIAVFDFDGTLSLIRGGWTGVMVEMMIEHLLPLRAACDESTMRARVTDFILDLNGQPTIFQMQRFVDEMHHCGGKPDVPEAYHHEYLRRLGERIDERKSAIRDGRATADESMVPGARSLLEALAKRGVELSLASGTEIEYVREEVAVLKLDHFFDGRIYGPGSDPRAFTKLVVMQDALARHRASGDVLLGFGDGVVETENVHYLGGTAIGVASDETGRSGQSVPWKRSRLVDAGAHVIVPDYAALDDLLTWLWDVG